MTVAGQNQLSCGGYFLTDILMNHCAIGRYINSAIFFCTIMSKDMVVIVNGSPRTSKSVVTIGEDPWQAELFTTHCANFLQCAGIIVIWTGQKVKLQFEFVIIARQIMSFQNFPGYCAFVCLILNIRLIPYQRKQFIRPADCRLVIYTNHFLPLR